MSNVATLTDSQKSDIELLNCKYQEIEKITGSIIEILQRNNIGTDRIRRILVSEYLEIVKCVK